jgi:hypothetical protein
MSSPLDPRVHLLGIRHHGPGSAALVRQALDSLMPACVLIEGPPEADDLIRFVATPGMKPPVAILLHAVEDCSAATFMPFAEFSPEWQAMSWALEHGRDVHFCDWPAAISLAERMAKERETPAALKVEHDLDPLDQLAEAAGYSDGEAFWNALIEQYGGATGHAVEIFHSIETTMIETRGMQQLSEAAALKEAHREAFMRIRIREAVRAHAGNIAVVCGAWHLSGLREPSTTAADRALIKDLPRIKINATWVPWTDSRLSAFTGYGAGVISPGWYRHLWLLYAAADRPTPEEFAAVWQARTASLLRKEGLSASTASAIEAARLALGLAALRERSLPSLDEMRDATLSTLCHGEVAALMLVEQKLYVGERVGEIGNDVPQMPLVRDLMQWQKRTRLKPEDTDVQVKLDLRSDAGLLKSTLLHRLTLIKVHWGKLLDAEAGRGTFREIWTVRWVPELSVALAEAVIHGITIEQAAGNATREQARASSSVTELAELVRSALVADLPDAATDCIAQLQTVATRASDLADVMNAVAPLVRVLRYGSARKLPEEALRALITSLSVEVNAGVRTGSHALDAETATMRVKAMRGFDEALGLFDDQALTSRWRQQLAAIVEDEQAAPAVAGLSLRRLHDVSIWEPDRLAAAFARHMSGHPPQHSGAFLEGFLTGGSEVILHDRLLLRLVDTWLCDLAEQDFIEALPLLRRSLSSFDAVSRRRLMEQVKSARDVLTVTRVADEPEENPAFAQALPLLYHILGIHLEEPQ